MNHTNHDDTQREKLLPEKATLQFASEEDPEQNGLFHDPWAAIASPASNPAVLTQQKLPGAVNKAQRQRITPIKIAAFAAVAAAVIAAGLGFYAYAMGAMGDTGTPTTPIHTATQHSSPTLKPTLVPTATPSPLPSPVTTTPAATRAKAQPAPAAPQPVQRQVMVAQPTVIHDSFQRNTLPGSWGTTNGLQWQLTGNPQAFFVNPGTNTGSGMIISQAQQNAEFYTATIGPEVAEPTDVQATLAMTFSTSQQNNVGLVVRWQDSNNYYKVYIDGSQLVLMKNINGQQSSLITTSFAAQDGAAYTLHFRAEKNGVLMASAWPAGQQEPDQWMLKATDHDLRSGQAGIRALLLNNDAVQVFSFQLTA